MQRNSKNLIKSIGADGKEYEINEKSIIEDFEYLQSDYNK